MYPTRDEILAHPLRHRRSTVRTVRAWKREFRGRRRSPEALRTLIDRLAALYRRPVSVRFARLHGASAYYTPATQTITLDGDDGSVVTTLHEFAHHLFGRSERQACRWSVWLYRGTFPRAYARLTWRGHMLVAAAASTMHATERE